MLCIYICDRLTLSALLAKVCNTDMPSSLIARKHSTAVWSIAR